MKNIKILSTHDTIEEAIKAAGGCNRDYNPSTFDREVERINKEPLVGAKFYVIDGLRPTVTYLYEADITLMNAFSPFSAGLSNGALELFRVAEENETLEFIFDFPNDRKLRKQIGKVQRENADRETLVILNI